MYGEWQHFNNILKIKSQFTTFKDIHNAWINRNLSLVVRGAVVSIVNYISVTKGEKKKLSIARIGLFVSALGIFGASALLMADILQHNFANAYVWSYSSTDLFHSAVVLHLLGWTGRKFPVLDILFSGAESVPSFPIPNSGNWKNM
jgi:hypothetical protein